MIAADLPDSEHDPAEVRELADEILSRSEYNDESILDRIGRAVDDFFEDVFGGIGLPFGGGRSGTLVGVLLLGLLIAAVVGLVTWAISSGRFGSGGRLRGAASTDAVVITDEDRTSEEWLVAAEEHEAEGRWRQGLLCRYRALVVTLCDRGVLADVAGRTAGEYVREVETNLVAASEAFTPATILFEDVWYGGADSGPGERDRFAELARVTLAVVGTGRRRSPTARELVGAGSTVGAGSSAGAAGTEDGGT